MAKPKPKEPMVPAYPITDEEVKEFDHRLRVWQKRLHLMNWRFSRGRRRPVANLADVRCYPEHRLVRYCVGRDWGSTPPEENAIEKLVVHELMHVRLNQMLDTAFKAKSYNEAVQGEEHDVIVVFEEVLVGMSRRIEKQDAEIAELKRQLETMKGTHGSQTA